MAGHPISARRRALIVGGSLGGLIAGNLFHRSGWDVHIFERTDGVLEGRGAGITILPGLVDAFRAAGVEEREEQYGVTLPARIVLDRAGSIVVERPFPQVMTSWRRLFEMLKAVFPAERYHSGVTLERIEQDAAGVTAHFSGGERMEGELLVGADGLRSTVRGQVLPEAKPFYPGYVAWRCLTDESALSAQTHALLFNRYTICAAPGEQGIGYAVPGPDYGIEPGHRQYNVVWYHPVREVGELPRMLTDDHGRYHANGIPPAVLSARVRDEMVAMAGKVLAPQLAEAVERARLHFFQPIVDLESPRLVVGRVAIVGDAAFVARPHVAMGVPKAGGDALALVEALDRSGGDYRAGLAAFEAQRLRVGRTMAARGRYLGAYMEAQLKSEEQRRQAERERTPDRVLETAMPFDYESSGPA
jgi:2-polyprenyl-6-methoxyphenol hydroxylase-like FAD-dependent oxidoreductase